MNLVCLTAEFANGVALEMKRDGTVKRGISSLWGLKSGGGRGLV